VDFDLVEVQPGLLVGFAGDVLDVFWVDAGSGII